MIIRPKSKNRRIEGEKTLNLTQEIKTPEIITISKKEKKCPEPKIEEPIIKMEEIVKEEIENIISEDIDVLNEEK